MKNNDKIIYWGISDTLVRQPLFIAWMDEGIVFAGFQNEENDGLSILKEEYPHTSLHRDDVSAQKICHAYEQHHSISDLPMPLHLVGTTFQQEVWHHLLQVPLGTTISYSDFAAQCGKPRAVRAVAHAIARNPVSYFVPCHRIVPAQGGTGNYRWGAHVKSLLITKEKGDFK